jgi:hypothetical protein
MARRATTTEGKQLKVVLPTDLHLKLVKHKDVYGQGIAATVEEALRRYFERLERERPDLAASLLPEEP